MIHSGGCEFFHADDGLQVTEARLDDSKDKEVTFQQSIENLFFEESLNQRRYRTALASCPFTWYAYPFSAWKIRVRFADTKLTFGTPAFLVLKAPVDLRIDEGGGQRGCR